MDRASFIAILDQKRAAYSQDLAVMIESARRGLKAENDPTVVWQKLAELIYAEHGIPDPRALAICAHLSEALIRLANDDTPGAVKLELATARQELAALAEAAREIRWKLRLTEYSWLADEELNRNQVQVADERWDRWNG